MDEKQMQEILADARLSCQSALSCAIDQNKDERARSRHCESAMRWEWVCRLIEREIRALNGPVPA